MGSVFMKETFRALESCDDFTLDQEKKAKNLFKAKLTQLFCDFDVDGDGFVAREEFLEFLKQDSIQAWFSVMGISPKFADVMFDIIDDGDGMITFEEFVCGFVRLRGGATSLEAVQIFTSMCK